MDSDVDSVIVTKKDGSGFRFRENPRQDTHYPSEGASGTPVREAKDERVKEDATGLREKIRKAGLLPLILIATFALGGSTGCPPPHDPTVEARAFARLQGGDEVMAVTCVTRDSDNDGYVSCAIFRKGADPLAVECTYLYGEHGCKLAQSKGYQQGTP